MGNPFKKVTGGYIFYCVQGVKDLEKRQQQIDKFLRENQLNDREINILQVMLEKLDTRRATPKPLYIEPAWKSEPATPKQIARLKLYGYSRDTEQLNKGDASSLIYRYLRLTGRLESEINSGDWVEENISAEVTTDELSYLGFDERKS